MAVPSARRPQIPTHLVSLPDLLQGVLATAPQKMWFMLDGAPAHFLIVLRNHIHDASNPEASIRRIFYYCLHVSGPESLGFLLL